MKRQLAEIEQAMSRAVHAEVRRQANSAHFAESAEIGIILDYSCGKGISIAMFTDAYQPTRTLMTYRFEDQEIDSIDLKTMLVSRGMRVANEIYSRYQHKARLSKNPLECNTLRLPDGTFVQLTDLSFHMEYISSVITWNMLKQVKYLPQLK